MGKTRPYRDLLLERLANPEVAQHYLNDALDESPDAFLKALETVAQARRVSDTITESAVTSQTPQQIPLDQSNLSFACLLSRLSEVGLKLSIALQPSSHGADISHLRDAHLASAGSPKATHSS